MAKNSDSPKMSDVARLAGVSSMTVSRALKPGTSVNDVTRELVRNAAEKLGYVFNSQASGLRSQRTGFVAVSIPSINNANFADTLNGLTEKLWGSPLQILLGYTDYDANKEEEIINQFLSRKPEAIVVTGGGHTEKCRQLLSQSQVPVVEMWDLPESPIDHVVGFSNASTSNLMVRHLYEQGYRKIGFIGGDTKRDARGLDRRRGFIEETKSLGLDSTCLVAEGIPPVTMREGAAAMRNLLKKWPETEAVMCVSDISAVGAMTECIRSGYRVPEDIAITGFGNYDLAEFTIPTITTIDVSAKEIGELVGNTILQQLEFQGDISAKTSIEIKPKLITRESTAVKLIGPAGTLSE